MGDIFIWPSARSYMVKPYSKVRSEKMERTGGGMSAGLAVVRRPMGCLRGLILSEVGLLIDTPNLHKERLGTPG